MKEFLWNLLFPSRCVICGELLTFAERKLCTSCAEHIPYLSACPHCGGRSEGGSFCSFCMKPYAFVRAYAPFSYALLRRTIHLFKYSGSIPIGRVLGDLLADYVLQFQPQLLREVDVMLAVPLHSARQRQRGFNQTHILCERLVARTGLPFSEIGLERKRDTVAQSFLSVQERRQNVRDAFRATADFSGKCVLLVDDIFTTGTTCQECAKELYRAGAAEVIVLCLSAAGV